MDKKEREKRIKKIRSFWMEQNHLENSETDYLKKIYESWEENKMNEIKKRKQKERKRLINVLIRKWEYANNKKVRAQELVDMVDKITYYLDCNQDLLLPNEQYWLMSLIRGLTLFLAEKSDENKNAINRQLKNLETLSENLETITDIFKK